MLKHIAAELPVVHEDALVAELSNGKFKVKSLSLTNKRASQVQTVIEDVRAEMKAHELNETVLQPGETIEFKRQAVISNNNTFPVRVYKVKIVRQGASINTECRSLVVEIHTKAEFEDYNAKLR